MDIAVLSGLIILVMLVIMLVAGMPIAVALGEIGRASCRERV